MQKIIPFPEKSLKNHPLYIFIAFGFVALYLVSLYNFLLFHTLSELIIAFIFASIFVIIWNSKEFLDNDYFLFLGITFLFTAILFLLGALTFKGISVFSRAGMNLAMQFWIVAQYSISIAFFVAPFFIKRKLRSGVTLIIVAGLTSLILAAIFLVKFPAVYANNLGPTLFGKTSLYIISGLFLFSIFSLLESRKDFNRDVLRLLIIALSCNIITELFFSFSIIDEDYWHLFGHLLALISTLFIYQAIAVSSLRKPYSVLFRNLRKSAEALQASEEKFRSIIESAGDAIVLADNEGKIAYWNNSAENIFGYKDKEVLGKPISMLMPEKFKEAHILGINRLRDGGNPRIAGKIVEFHGIRKNREEFPIELSISSWKVNDEMFFGAVIRDITFKYLTQAALKASEEKFRNIFEHSPIGKEVYDAKGKLISANETSMQIFGIRNFKDEINFNLFNDPNITEEMKNKLKNGEVIKFNGIFSFDEIRKRKIFKTDRTGVININEIISPLDFDESGRPSGYLAQIQDITDEILITRQLEKAKELAEDRAKEAEMGKQLLEAIINYIPEGIAVADTPDRKISLINEYGQEMLGRPLSKIKGLSLEEYHKIWRIFDPFDNKLAKSEILPLNRSVTNGDVIIDAEWTLKNDSDKLTPILCNSGPIKDKKGNITGGVMVWRDITKRKKNELRIKMHTEAMEKLASEMEKFKLAVDNASDLIVITDNNGKIIYANLAACEITGFTLGEIVGEKKVPWGGNMPKEYYQKMWNTIKIEKKPFSGELINSRKNGEKYTAEIHISPVLDEKGNIMFFVGIGRDITKAKEIDKAKSEFLSMASHQLRTPLASASLSIEMLLGGIAGNFTRDQKKYLNQIYGDIWNMAGLIDAFLNVSRIEMGVFPFDPKPTDICKIASLALEKVKPQIKHKNLKLEKRFANNLPLVNVDPNMTKTAVENLLTNAVKYTPEKGKMGFEIYLKKSVLVIKVSDTGLGIPKRQHKDVFKKLFRASNAISSQTEGIGIGLYVVKTIIQKMGGKIWFESKENKGSTFYVSFPVKLNTKKI